MKPQTIVVNQNRGRGVVARKVLRPTYPAYMVNLNTLCWAYRNRAIDQDKVAAALLVLGHSSLHAEGLCHFWGRR